METKKELTYVSRNDKILNEYDFWKEMNYSRHIMTTKLYTIKN